MTLLSKDFLLTNEMGKKLFHDHAANMPIIDYHCHLVPKEIYENKNYPNLTRIWINDGNFGDHYKWRLMRANGVPEELITGDGDEYEKLVAWAKTIEKAIGNPLYEWTHLELQRFFHIDEPFTSKNVKSVWDKANQLLATDAFKPRNLIKNMNVKVVCTTDDPASDLKYHKLLKAEEAENGFKVLPAMRPDKAFAIEADTYGAYLKELGAISKVDIKDYDSLVKAFDTRFAYFESLGGRLSDHGLNTFHFVKVSKSELDTIIAKGAENAPLTQHDIDAYATGLIEALMRLNKKYNWTMQYHMNAIRSANKPMFKKIGADTGFDSMGTQPDIAQEIMKLLTDMQNEDNIPKTILYSLNPNDWMQLATGMGDFYEGDAQKLQLGCAWWFNDTREGMREQLRIMAQQSLLANFVGMLTDSRSFLSYPRHEYFRRVLCDYIGELVQRGQLPDDEAYLGQIVEDISYNNAHDYFGFFK
ncbi:glucuronate isomerase [Agrilactobacillus composti DSM 18527 = JCM 14202]|uniref:Uronate isomerase n=1 Tax=Agrilactobacillus composti DSM 18527 = JCM 14202 TaxID=1423734 RepID=X0QPG2_9LACO|nr:glucuronate isomerase [Agrilactobacillus composti]KRM35075.1 glucuronate isomerase [Agrilactobacillus composti DSM 18527 = JCM 14202]GAF40480.1 uronate isomerase [Agrilactobacillus composti DSM 18527 = JCM 14202]